MKKKDNNSWIYRMKTLPNTEPFFASGLCSMVSLWLVLVPALIMAIMGFEIHIKKLIIPSIGSLILAIFIFIKWMNLALKAKEEKR